LIDKNDGYFVCRSKPDANPVVAAELREWRGDAIPLEGNKIHYLVDDLYRKYIDVEIEPEFKCEPYNGTLSLYTERFRVVDVRDEDDDYHLYIKTYLVRSFPRKIKRRSIDVSGLLNDCFGSTRSSTD